MLWPIGIAGVSFASAVGLSVYVTFAFAVFMAAWMVMAAVKQNWAKVGTGFGAALTAVVACIPFLLELRAGQAMGSSAGGPALQLSVLPFKLIQAAVIDGPSSVPPPWLPLLYLAVLPLSYFLEMGFFFAILDIKCRQIWRGASKDACAAVMAGSSILVSVFVSSKVIAVNDLARRGILPAQFVLLLWAAELWASGALAARSSPTRAWLACSRPLLLLAFLGVAGSAYELGMVRWFPVISDQISGSKFSFLASDRQLGRRTYCLRQAYEYLTRVLPQSAVVQQNPHTEPGDLPYGLYADRQTAAEDRGMRCRIWGRQPALPGSYTRARWHLRGVRDAKDRRRGCDLPSIVHKRHSGKGHDKCGWTEAAGYG